MSDRFPLYDESTAPAAARAALAATKQSFGMIPNLERVMAAEPALLGAYCMAEELFETTSLTPIERQVVFHTANFENECDYCVPWHTHLSKKAGMLPEDIEALCSGTPMSTGKLEALRAFAQRLVHTRGKITLADLASFLEAGYSEPQALEVVLGLAIKTMSNYTNSIAGTPLDRAVQSFRWQKPKIAMRADSDGPAQGGAS